MKVRGKVKVSMRVRVLFGVRARVKVRVRVRICFGEGEGESEGEGDGESESDVEGKGFQAATASQQKQTKGPYSLLKDIGVKAATDSRLRVFTKWVNATSGSAPVFRDLVDDLTAGVILSLLVSALTCKKI